MTLDDFVTATEREMPPAGLAPLLLALWHDARDDWDAAHGVAQDIHTDMGSRVHAYLHRKEGDASNAAYWYRRAGVPVERGSLDQEWRTLAGEMLRANTPDS